MVRTPKPRGCEKKNQCSNTLTFFRSGQSCCRQGIKCDGITGCGKQFHLDCLDAIPPKKKTSPGKKIKEGGKRHKKIVQQFLTGHFPDPNRKTFFHKGVTTPMTLCQRGDSTKKTSNTFTYMDMKNQTRTTCLDCSKLI